jgi:tetratricopeptide (TPR) repeat protein
MKDKAEAIGAKEAYERGAEAHDQGDFAQAISYFTQSIEIDPNCADAYYNRTVARGFLANMKKRLQVTIWQSK